MEEVTIPCDGDKAVAIFYGSGIVHCNGACGGGGAMFPVLMPRFLHDACLCTVVGTMPRVWREGGVRFR